MSEQKMPARILAWKWDGLAAGQWYVEKKAFAYDVTYIRSDLVREAMEALSMIVDGKEIYDTQAADGSTVVVPHDPDLVEHHATAALSKLKEAGL